MKKTRKKNEHPSVMVGDGFGQQLRFLKMFRKQWQNVYQNS